MMIDTVVPFSSPNPRPPTRVLLLPGWRNSGPGHWQTEWERRHGDVRVEQDNWQWPLRGDWMTRLEEALLALPDGVQAVLAAHSLGCHLVAAWASHSSHAGRVAAALLVAPPDLQRPDLAPPLAPWSAAAGPGVRLPFVGQVVYSLDDPYCTPARAREMADGWACGSLAAGALGHLNADSGLGAWAEGRALLKSLAAGVR